MQHRRPPGPRTDGDPPLLLCSRRQLAPPGVWKPTGQGWAAPSVRAQNGEPSAGHELIEKQRRWPNASRLSSQRWKSNAKRTWQGEGDGGSWSNGHHALGQSALELLPLIPRWGCGAAGLLWPAGVGGQALVFFPNPRGC